MASTMLLDRTTWDLILDVNGNIALATEPYSLAQDAASAILTWLGECYWDTTVGVPWQQQIVGKPPSLSLLRAKLIAAAETVPDVLSAKVFFIALDTHRIVRGQVQVTSVATQQISAATFVVPFETVSPQGF
jgi:hypothetical protein